MLLAITASARFDGWNVGTGGFLKRVKEALNRLGFILVANHSLDYGSGSEAECAVLSVIGTGQFGGHDGT